MKSQPATKRLKFYKLCLLTAFIATEICLYLSFMILQATQGGEYHAIKYSAILVCLATSLLLIPCNKTDAIVLSIAFIFTAIADLFIFVLDDRYEVGVTMFIFAQTAYFARIRFVYGKGLFVSTALRLTLIAIALTLFNAFEILQPLTALVAVYFIMLIFNAVESLFLVKTSKQYLLFFFGLLLFIGCDVCVGLNNFSMIGISLSAEAMEFVGVAMWAFYLPSQVLIALSSRNEAYPLFRKKGATNETTKG